MYIWVTDLSCGSKVKFQPTETLILVESRGKWYNVFPHSFSSCFTFHSLSLEFSFKPEAFRMHYLNWERKLALTISQPGEAEVFAITVTHKITRAWFTIIFSFFYFQNTVSKHVRVSTIQSIRLSTSSFFFRNDKDREMIYASLVCLPLCSKFIYSDRDFHIPRLTIFATRSFYEIPTAFEMHILCYIYYILILNFLFLPL